MAIAYCQHPVTKENKAKLRAAGFKILDIAYKPKKLEDGDKEVKHTKKKADK